MMGVKKTGDFLEKSTWILAISLITLILISSFFVSAPQEKTINHDNTNKIDFTP